VGHQEAPLVQYRGFPTARRVAAAAAWTRRQARHDSHPPAEVMQFHQRPDQRLNLLFPVHI